MLEWTPCVCPIRAGAPSYCTLPVINTMNALYREIREQPARIADCLVQRGGVPAAIAEDLHRRGLQSMALVARGTSRHAAVYASYLLGRRNGMPAYLIQPSLSTFLGQLSLPPRAGLIGISQSGASPDLCHILRTARAQGTYTLAVTNTAGSPLARHADAVLDIQAGRETATAATKTYVNQLVSMALLSSALAGHADTAADLEHLPQAVEAVFAMEAEIRAVAQILCAHRTLLVVGRGYHHATACEMALKMQEMTYTYALPFTSADFIHGPQALLDSQALLLCIDTGRQENPQFAEIAARAVQTEAGLVVLTHHPARWEQATHMMVLPDGARVADHLSPIPAIVACQLLAMHIGLAKGLDVMAPRYLVKETLTA